MANNLGLFGLGEARPAAPPRIMSLLAPGLQLTPDQVAETAEKANARKVRDTPGEGGPGGRGRIGCRGFRGGGFFNRGCPRGRAKRSLGSRDQFLGQGGALDSAVGSADKRQVREAEANLNSDDMIHQQLESINKKMEQISADLESKEK